MTSRMRLLVAGLVLLAFLVALKLQPGITLGAYLAAWWFWMGVLLGGLANVWVHNLTGGQWGEAIRTPLLRYSRTIWIAALLFVPVLLGMDHLFSWMTHTGEPAHWAGELSAPQFKRIWLSPVFFIARSLLYLATWVVLAHLSHRDSLARSKPFSAIALIVYGATSGLASVDWMMSLMPLWYSSVFGWLVNAGQMLGGMALGVAVAMHSHKRPSALVSRDLGNLLLMYIMLWAYLAFSQFLIIWAEDLPHEIIWYVARRDWPWLATSWVLALGLFFLPLLLLLSRTFKQTPRAMAWLGGALLFMQFINTSWLILPSLPVSAVHWLWALPLATVALAVLALAVWCGRKWKKPASPRELRHA